MKVRCKNSQNDAGFPTSGGDLIVGKIYDGEGVVHADWESGVLIFFLIFNERNQWKLYPAEYFEPAWSDGS